jgi:hypothetical protein
MSLYFKTAPDGIPEVGLRNTTADVFLFVLINFHLEDGTEDAQAAQQALRLTGTIAMSVKSPA